MNVISSHLSKLKQKELLFQTALSFMVRVLAALAGFIVSILISRQLGAEEAGYYFLAFSVVMVLATISRVGLDNTVVRFVGAAAPDGEWGIVRSVMRRSVLLASLVSVPVAVSVYCASDFLAITVFNKPDLSAVLKAISPGIVGLSIFTLVAMGLQGLRKVVSSVLTVNILVNFFLLVALLISAAGSATDTAWFYSVAALLTVIIGYVIYLQSIGSGGGQVSWAALFQSCLPLWVVVVMSQLAQYSGQFIAGAWVSSGEVAQLAVAQRTAMLTSFVLMAVNLVVAPRFASLYKNGELQKLKDLALHSVRLMVFFALPIVALMLLFPELILSLFGEGFSEGALLLQILAIGQFINVATGSVGYLLTMSGHEKDLRNTVLISGPAAIGLAFVLVPFYGIVGSAIATAVAIIVQNLFAVWLVKRRLGFNTLAVWKL